MTGEAFAVLLVCTGNICRSPIAEQVLRAQVPEGPVRFSSAGTGANPGVPMTPEAAEMSRSLGGDPDRHLSRRLTRDVVASSGLVLTASREHRARTVELFPRASAYTFTIRQFARLLSLGELEPFADGAELVAQIASRRGYAPPAAPAEDDIPDPYRRSLAVYQTATALTGEAVTKIAPTLRLIG